MDDLLKEFLTETSENLAVLDVELVRLEQNPNDMDMLGNIFRLVHTVKGTCGFLGLSRLESVAHAGENVLGKVRDGEIEVGAEAVSLILECLDRIRAVMTDLEATGAEPAGDDTDLIKRLNAFAGIRRRQLGARGCSPAPAAAAPAPVSALAAAESSASIYDQIGGMGTVDAVVEVFFNRVTGDLRVKQAFEGASIDHLQGQMRDYLAKLCGGPDSSAKSVLFDRGMNDAQFDAACGHMQAALNQLEVSAALSARVMGMVFATRDEATTGATAPVSVAAPAEDAVAEAVAKPAKAAAKKDAEGGATELVANQTIRVNVDVLENLMTLVSELVLTRNQLLQILRRQKDSEFAAPLQRLNHITSELQEGVMKTRMQPIGNAWNKLPRLVRDLATN